jgi:hypothetical protein
MEFSIKNHKRQEELLKMLNTSSPFERAANCNLGMTFVNECKIYLLELEGDT